MPNLNPEIVATYISAVLGVPVCVRSLSPLGRDDPGVKSYGYGTPVRVDYEAQGEARIAVLHTVRPGPFGHEHMADRAAELLWEHHAFNRLPRHIRSLDAGAFLKDGRLIPVGAAEEFCLLTGYAEGREYAEDLQRIGRDGVATPADFSRADALCDYLASIHEVRGQDPELYLRRIRELVGGNECIFGLTDSSPPGTCEILERIEHLCLGWRWKLKRYTHRLRQVHGDFHPWNILFETDRDFTVLDRSRGEFGDPADDVTCLTLNYVFFSLQRSGRLEGAFENLFRRFWGRYLDRTGDREILRVAAPFCAFRGLVMASPVWYPALGEPVRSALFRMILAVLEEDAFDPASINHYCGV